MTDENNIASAAKTVEFKISDRVRRVKKAGPLGTVKALREEVVGSSGEANRKEVLVKIQWDNGTLSYFAPESIELVS